MDHIAVRIANAIAGEHIADVVYACAACMVYAINELPPDRRKQAWLATLKYMQGLLKKDDDVE